MPKLQGTQSKEQGKQEMALMLQSVVSNFVDEMSLDFVGLRLSRPAKPRLPTACACLPGQTEQACTVHRAIVAQAPSKLTRPIHSGGSGLLAFRGKTSTEGWRWLRRQRAAVLKPTESASPVGSGSWLGLATSHCGGKKCPRRTKCPVRRQTPQATPTSTRATNISTSE